ncbi:hypothetical protein HY797_03950 [Candidatus Falkowbacteria bacterium]|nr:hypothetical protein [Candidatus Falkowbacteria bacterium]
MVKVWQKIVRLLASFGIYQIEKIGGVDKKTEKDPGKKSGRKRIFGK